MRKFYNFIEKVLHTNKVHMLLVMVFCLFVNNVSAQIAVTVTNNTNTTPNLAASYTSLATALTDLNAVTAMSGPVTLTLAAGSETAPPSGLLLGSTSLNTVLNATNTLTIIGAGSTTILNAGVGTATPASAVPDGILKLVGVDYVTIDGLTFTDGNTTNPATMEVGLGMFKLSATDGCQNNTVQNCIFNMQRVNFVTGTAPMVEGSVGIAMMNSTALASTTVLTVTAATGTSSNNKFYSNQINGGNYGIVLRGFTAATPFTLADTNNDVGGISALTGNTILNYGGGAAATNPSAAIRIVDQWGFNASYNISNNNNGSGVNHVSTLRGIITSGSTSASGTINNNTITLFGGGTTSQLDGISNGAGGTAASNTINVNNNTILLNYASATGATINGIVNTASAAIVNINNNNVSAASVIPGTGTHILISGGSPTTLNILGNTVSNFQRSSATTGTLRGIVFASPTTTNITNNIVTNLGYTNIASTGIIDGIYGQSSSVNVTISNNQVYGFRTATGVIRGINEFGSAGNKVVLGNLVYDFANTTGYTGGGVVMVGIRMQTGNISISSNKVYGITSAGTGLGATVLGIEITGGTDGFVSNNLIGDLFAPIATSLNAVRGIDIAGGSVATRIYNNTVRISASSTSVTTFGTSCLTFSTTPASMDVRNNIFVNTSTPAQDGTNVATNGIAAAIRRSAGTAGTVPVNYATTSNNNIIWVNPTAGTNNHASYAEGLATVTNVQNTVANLKTFMVNRDQVSVEENPTFVSTTGVDATFLHIDTVTPTFADGGASSIGIVTIDYDGDLRNISTPDIGADEFNGVSLIPSCTGTPAVANTLSSNNNFCAGTSTNLSLDVTYTTLNNTYQWESSSDNITYNPISGANSASLSLTPLVSTWYRCIVTCTSSGFSSTSTPVQVIVNQATYASIPLTESFETTWTTSCVLAPLGQDTPNNSWRMIRGAADADASWRADNTTTVLSGWGSTGGAYTPISQDGARSARFHSFNVSPAGTQGTLDLYVDLSTPGTKQLSYWYIAPSTGIDQLDVLLSEDGGLTFNTLTTTPAIVAPTTAVTVWTNITASIASISPTSIIRFRGTGDNGSFDIGLDNVSITLPCSGTPTAGTITSPALACSGTPFNLVLNGNSTGSGITYQWQSSPDGIAPFTDISGQTSSTATVSQTASTFYQCIITCTNGGASVTTTPVQVNMNSLLNCYCSASYSNNASDNITNVSLGTLSNPSTVGIAPFYTYYSALPATNLTQGSTQTLSVTVSSHATQWTTAWIDWNRNGVLEASESIGAPINPGANGTAVFNFTVPVGASLGLTRLRIRGGDDVIMTTSQACGTTNSTWGETEDYDVNITPCVAPSITTQPVVTVSICENAAVNLSIVGAGTGLTYQWKKDTVDIPSATSATYSIPSSLVADSGSYTVLVTGACGTILSDASTVTVTANSTLPTEVISVCDTYTWAANGLTYTTSGLYTSTVNCVTRNLDLTITPSSTLPTEVISVCDTYTWAANGTTYTTSGLYTSTVNCVTRNLDLTITPSSTLPTEVISVCDTYTWAANGLTYTTSGMYTSTVNCVTRNLDLTITPSSSLPTEVVSACDSYTWDANTTTYTVGGTYTSTTNCVTRTLNLTINASTTTTTNVTVCDTYTWAENGATYTVGGTYTNVTTNGAGCPNTATLNLVVTNASIDFANLQFPASATICEGGTMTAYGQVYEAGLTEAAGQAAGIDVEFGYNTSNTNPNTWSTWTPATFNVQVGNNDEYLFTTSNALTGGTYYYTFRYRLSGCSTWQYGGDNNGFWNGTTQNSGVLTINAATISGATTQVVNEGVAADATIEDIVVTSNGTVTWFASASDAASNSNPLPAGTVLVNGNIYYGVTNIGACRSTTLAVTVTVVLGNTSFDLSQLSYYPNPVRDIFNVKYSKEIISVDVFDLTGRNVINIKPNALNVQVNMTNLSSAMYIVRLQSVDGIKELKVYKN